MFARDDVQPAMRPVGARSVCVVMICSDAREADQVGRQLMELNNGCLVTYRKAEDFLFNAPRSRAALVILAAEGSTGIIRTTLGWLRRRWPGCPTMVIADEGGGEQEMAAREGGAMFLTRPVGDEQWAAMLSQALRTAVAASPARTDGQPNDL